MFNCEKCSVTSKQQEKPNVKVLKTRSKVYYKKIENTLAENEEDRFVFEYQGEGFETVKEAKLCKDCYNIGL